MNLKIIKIIQYYIMNNHIWNIQNIVLLNQKEPKLKILIDKFTRQLPKKWNIITEFSKK